MRTATATVSGDALVSGKGILRGVTWVATSAGATVSLNDALTRTAEEEQLWFCSNRTGNYELFLTVGNGPAATQMTSNTTYDSWWPKVSPDGTKVLFCRTPAGSFDDYTQMTLWTMNIDGSNAAQVMGLPATVDATWVAYGHPEWSPDGTEIVIFAVTGAGVSAIVTRNATTWASDALLYFLAAPNGVVDPSYSPDGTKVVFAEEIAGVPKISRVDSAAGANYTVIQISDDLAVNDPYYSPDAATIAYLAQTGAVGAAGEWAIKSCAATATSNPAANAFTVIDDGNANSKPAWASDSTRIFFHRFDYDALSWNLAVINDDGTGLAGVTSTTGAEAFPEAYYTTPKFATLIGTTAVTTRMLFPDRSMSFNTGISVTMSGTGVLTVYYE